MHRAQQINTLYNMRHTCMHKNNHNLCLHKYQWIKDRQRQKGKVFVIFIVTCSDCISASFRAVCVGIFQLNYAASIINHLTW